MIDHRALFPALAFLAVTAAAQVTVPRDDIKSRSVHWNLHLVTPLLLSADESELYAVNQRGQRLAILDPATLAKLADLPVGPGVVAMAQLPGSSELWLVDKVDSSVVVVDLNTRTLVRSLRVGAAPNGIAFAPSGDRAYVTCSGVDTVDVIETASFTVATTIPIPAENPRAIVHHQGRAWVAPMLSGNNTAPMGAAATGPDVDDIVEVRSLADFPALNQLPDRDLFAIPTTGNPSLDVLDPSSTRTGLGTLLLNLHARPGTNELWIPHTDALNAVHKGEKSFAGGQCVLNRITIVDSTGVLPPQIVDLDALAPEGLECAQPTGLAFDPVRSLVYVCGYGSDRVAVLDVSGGAPTWFGAIDIPFAGGYPAGANPRTCIVDAQGDRLYVLNKGNSSVTKFDLTELPATAGFAVSAPSPAPIGFATVSGVERFGHNDLSNARNSKSQTTSCASCHLDGHRDGLAWNLGKFHDAEGTPNEQLAFPLDDKGPMVTQSVRRMFGTGRYHWRGDRLRLKHFNQAFIDLMEREENGEPQHLGAHFHYLERYMQRVSYLPNPRQQLDRSLTPEEASGAQIFTQQFVLNSATCASCHMLPLGTSGEIVPSHVRGKFPAMDVPQLRGVADKLSPPHLIGGEFGTRTELGAGLSHGGAFATFRDLLLAPHPTEPGPAFALTSAEADDLAAFLDAFDTGLAPSTGYLATANASNAATFQAAELDYLTQEATNGNCDLIYRGAPETFGNTSVWPSGLFDPQTGAFRVAQAGAPQKTIATLLTGAANGSPVTFLGVPLWMGEPLALDRDMDELYDLDELTAGTDPENGDSDQDGFPDGYELLHGMDPLVVEGSSPDVVAPTLLGAPTLIYKTTNAIKFEIRTSEACTVDVALWKVVLRLPLQPNYDDRFSIILNEFLEPGTSYTIGLTLTDPAGNQTQTSVVYSTEPRFFSAHVNVDEIALSLERVQGGTPLLVADVTLAADGLPPAPGYVVTADVFHDDQGTLTMIASDLQTTLTGTDGTVTFELPLPSPAYTAGLRSAPPPSAPAGLLYFVVRSVTEPPNDGAPLYAPAQEWSQLEFGSWKTIRWN